MYSYVRLEVAPSQILERLHLGLHIAFFILYLYSVIVLTWQQFLYLLPLVMFQSIYLYRLLHKRFYFQLPRVWLYHQGHWYKNDENIPLSVSVYRLWPSFFIIQYRNLYDESEELKWEWVWRKDCQLEYFRRFKLVLNLYADNSRLRENSK